MNLKGSQTEKNLLILNAVPNLNSSALFGCETGTFTSQFGKAAGLLEKAEGGRARHREG